MIKRVTSHGRSVTKYDEFHACTSDGYIHATQVAQESYLPFIIGTYQGDNDDVAFLSLKTIHGIYADAGAEGFCPFFLPEQLTQILHLGTVGRDDAHIQSLVQDALFANQFEIGLER